MRYVYTHTHTHNGGGRTKPPPLRITADQKEPLMGETMIKKLFSALCVLILLMPPVAFSGAPVYNGTATYILNGGIPNFSEDEITDIAFIEYTPLDKWQRAVKATACLGPETLALAGRTAMQSLEPSGWQTDFYDFVPGFNLYQRCHLIGDQLGGDELIENLVTGTQYLNIVGMLPIEAKVAEYISRTGHHVMYRAWPYYKTGDLVCEGVQLEALSVEDEEIRINAYCFNVQPGVSIDYRTGVSALARTSVNLAYTEKSEEDLKVTVRNDQLTYVLNTNTKRFHKPECSSVKDIKPKNYQETTLSREQLIDLGYKPCGRCNP